MASSAQLMGGGSVGGGGPRYVQMQSEPSTPLQPPSSSIISSFFSFRQGSTPESGRIFDELPQATIVSVSRPDPSDISPVQLSYTIEVQYKQVPIRDQLTEFELDFVFRFLNFVCKFDSLSFEFWLFNLNLNLNIL